MALGLSEPWTIENIKFDAVERRLDIFLDFKRGSSFACPKCGKKGCKAYDTEEAVWRHLNFFQHTTYLHARRPRTDCGDCGILSTDVPWARPGSGFTYLFESFVMILVREMSLSAAARILGEHDTRIWRILNHYVTKARDAEDLHGVTKVGVDETSMKKGHNYVTVGVDMEKSKVIFATKGKDSTTLARFNQDLHDHGGDADFVREVSCDMSPAFIQGAEDYFVNARITFDKFHVMKIINDAVDLVRREEQKCNPDLKRSRYLWLKNAENLTSKQKILFENLSKQNLKTVRAYQLKLSFQEFWNQSAQDSEAFLKKWYFWASHSRLEPMVKAAKTIKKHWNGILRWFESGLTNGILEGINSLIQLAKKRARGFRNVDNYITMIFLTAGKLNFKLPT
jgi:transposase